MGYPLDHHFIPAFFLGKWAGANDKIVEYTIKYQKLIPKPVGRDATGFVKGLYSFPELPPEAAQYIEQVFFDYADRVAADALEKHIFNKSGPWTVELRSAWSRFLIGLHTRHPDAMPELRAAAKSVWESSGPAHQTRYEAIKASDDPATFDEFLASKDPLASAKMQVNIIIKVFDNEILGRHVNSMTWGMINVSSSSFRFLLSDRPVVFANLNNEDGVVYLPISPEKLFVAVNKPDRLRQLQNLPAREIVHHSNRHIVGRARRFVWSHDQAQAAFIEKHMSKRIEPTPLFPGLGKVL